jgi:hypothetical protein
MGQCTSMKTGYKLENKFSSFDRRVNIEYQLIVGKVKESEVRFSLSDIRKLS